MCLYTFFTHRYGTLAKLDHIQGLKQDSTTVKSKLSIVFTLELNQKNVTKRQPENSKCLKMNHNFFVNMAQ